MNVRVTAIFAVLSLGAVAFYLLSPAVGYTLVIGDSMEPAIPAGCTVVASEPWDGESSLEGEIVSYDSASIEYGTTGFSRLDAAVPVAHRVVAEYETYEMDEANHYVTEDGLLIAESGAKVTMTVSAQEYRDATALEGEHVLVLAGDSNRGIDPALVPADDVIGVLDAKSQYSVSDGDSWPCNG